MLAALIMVITVVITIPITRQGDGAGVGDRLPGLMGHMAPTLRVFPGGKADGLEPTLGSAYPGLRDLRQVTQPL